MNTKLKKKKIITTSSSRVKPSVVKKKITLFRPNIRSRHPSHNVLRGVLPLMPFRSVIRLGSTTDLPESTRRVEINSVAAIKNSSSKLLMKLCFDKNKVRTAPWCLPKDLSDKIAAKSLLFPIVAKHIFGSRGRGNFLLKDQSELDAFLTKAAGRISSYIFEQYMPYVREYRLHVNSDGCFYTCRKMLKADTPEGKRWFRNDSNSTWILENNEMFDKPTNWSTIVADCVNCLKAVGLDFGACDVRVQSSKDKKGNTRKEEPDYFIVEINSAPSFGEVTSKKYMEVLPRMLRNKANA